VLAYLLIVVNFILAGSLHHHTALPGRAGGHLLDAFNHAY